MSQKLFEEFPNVTTEQWLEVVQKDLKGADFEKRLVTETLDGIKLRPFYRSEDLLPSEGSVVRGFEYQALRPAFREEIREPDIAVARKHALSALERGAYEISVLNYPMGVPIRNAADMAAFTDGIWIDAVPIHWMSGPYTRPILAMIKNEAKRRGLDPASLQGSVEFDPIMDRCAGWVAGGLDGWKDEFHATFDELMEFTNLSSLTIRGSYFEKAGASLAQELAFSLALFSEYLGEIAEHGDQQDLIDLVTHTEFRLGVGTNYFLEISKIRAMKLLIQNVLGAYGVDNVRPKIHAITTSSNKTLYDPYNNLLRATVEAMAATVAGVDSISVAAYDQGYSSPDEFSAHLTRNTEALLLEEAYVGRVADPLGGSYTVERLTNDYAKTAWAMFKEIEAQGGFVKAWSSGSIVESIKAVQTKRTKQVGTRRRTIVGTTVYPNPKEHRIGDVRPRSTPYQVSVPLTEIGDPDKLQLDDFLTGEHVPTSVLDSFRPSWPFEYLRLRVERYVLLGNAKPSILLAEFGNKKMRRARSMFVQGFLGAGGYDLIETVVESPADLLAEVESTKPNVVVLCSEDPAYLPFVKELSLDTPVVIAGNPVDDLEALKAAGVSDFIHLRLDQLDTLERYHAVFGIPEIPTDEPLMPEAI